jgi:hypothetical protein
MVDDATSLFQELDQGEPIYSTTLRKKSIILVFSVDQLFFSVHSRDSRSRPVLSIILELGNDSRHNSNRFLFFFLFQEFTEMTHCTNLFKNCNHGSTRWLVGGVGQG